MDAAEFVSLLLPNVKFAMEGMSNPEAREVATDCHKILESINTTVEPHPKAEVEAVLAVSPTPKPAAAHTALALRACLEGLAAGSPCLT